MADDLDDLIARFESIASVETRKRIDRKALRAAANIVEPALRAATPERVEDVGGPTSLAVGELKKAVKTTMRIDPEGEGSTAKIGFGKLHLFAERVDEGHHNPNAKKAGKKSFTPANPFVRSTEEATAAAAAEAFVSTMAAEVEKELSGRG